MAVNKLAVSSLANLIARLGLQAEKVGSTVIAELRELMVDAFHQEDRQHHRLSSYFLPQWTQEEEIISYAMTTFFNINGAKERELIDGAIQGLDDKKAKVNAYLIGLLMTALLKYRDVVDKRLNVDHTQEFSHLITKWVESKFGESFLERFKPFADHCQKQYNNKAAENVVEAPKASFSPGRSVTV